MRAKKVLKNGKQFLHFERFNVKIHPGTKNIHLTNLFQENPAMEELANAFINGYSDLFLTDVYPGIENSLADTFTRISNSLTGEATFDEVFPNI